MDAVRRRLKKRRVGQHVQAGGLDDLVKRWTEIATYVEYGVAEWMEEEWLNDLDVREILEDLFDHVPESRVAREAVEVADKRFAASTVVTDECQWGEINAATNGWTPEKNWWYWRKPPTPYV